MQYGAAVAQQVWPAAASHPCPLRTLVLLLAIEQQGRVALKAASHSCGLGGKLLWQATPERGTRQRVSRGGI